MSTSARRRVAVTWTALFAVAAIVDVCRGHTRPDAVSFDAGHAAVSNAARGVAPLVPSGVSTQSICDELLDRRIVAADSNRLVRRDFVSGCRRAIAETAE